MAKEIPGGWHYCAIHNTTMPVGMVCLVCDGSAAYVCDGSAAYVDRHSPRARQLEADRFVQRALGKVSTDEEPQADFEGEEPTQDARQQFNREWLEARHGEDGERIKALHVQVEELKRDVASLEQDKRNLHLRLAMARGCTNIAMDVGIKLAKERDELRAQLERVLKEKQPQLRSERRVLVDIDD